MKKDTWTKTTTEFMEKVSLSYTELRNLSKTKMKEKIKVWETKKWREEVEEKSSLVIYKRWKNEMKSEETLYDNRPASVIFYKARTNNLNLNDRNRHTNGDTKCIMCGCDMEDLIHFILWCQGYWEMRIKEPLFQQPYVEDEVYLVGQLLFEKNKRDKVKDTLYQFWKKRELKRKAP